MDMVLLVLSQRIYISPAPWISCIFAFYSFHWAYSSACTSHFHTRSIKIKPNFSIKHQKDVNYKFISNVTAMQINPNKNRWSIKLSICSFKENREGAPLFENTGMGPRTVQQAASYPFYLYEESALYCSSGGKAPAGATDGLILYWGHGAWEARVKVKKQTFLTDASLVNI